MGFKIIKREMMIATEGGVITSMELVIIKFRTSDSNGATVKNRSRSIMRYLVVLYII